MDYRKRTDIERVLRAAGIHPGTWARAARLESRAASGDDGALEWILTTERPTLVFDWERWELVEEVLLADGMLVPACGQVPLLDSHNRFSVDDVLGHVRDFKEATAGEYPARTATVRFAEDAKSQSALGKVTGGHITDGSVGYRVLKSVYVPEGEQVAVNGRMFDGPVRVTYSWELKEFSITPIGADVLAKVQRLCGSVSA